MNRLFERASQVAMGTALRIAPRERADWFAAMAAEFAHVPPAKRASYAAGCLTAAIQSRALAPDFIEMAAKAALVVGAAFWVLLNIRFASLPVASEAPALRGFTLVVATLFAAGAIATMLRGFAATLALALPALALSGAAALAVMTALPPSPGNRLFTALLVENATMLVLAIGIALAAPALASARREKA